MKKNPSSKDSNKVSNYKAYLFEFVVIFIAIVGSFFADNLREHFIDKHKEKELMASMLLDLKEESQRVKNVKNANEDQILGLDSLLHVMNDNHESANNLFHRLNFKYASDYNAFMPVDRTLNQLMNSGGLSLIRKMSVSNEIVLYSNEIKGTINQAELLETRYQRILDQQKDILDIQQVMKLKQDSSILNLKEYPDLLTTDKKTINAYYYTLVVFKGAIVGYVQRLNDMMTQNALLTKMIQDEYKLKNNPSFNE